MEGGLNARRVVPVVWALLALVSGAVGWADEIRGRLVLMEKGGRQVARGEDPTRAVVWFEPASGAEGGEPVAGEIVTRRKDFEPKVLAVPRGSRIEFPNRDPILHNVFSVSPGNTFDLGFVRRGESEAAVFPEPGVVRIFCNVHQDMVAHVVVLDTPWYTRPAEDGTFRLEGVPRGPGRLHVWHERAETRAFEIDPGDAPLEARLEITQPRIPPHLNKFGRRYGRSRGRY